LRRRAGKTGYDIARIFGLQGKKATPIDNYLNDVVHIVNFAAIWGYHCVQFRAKACFAVIASDFGG
jgi:hypothetical protein